jgi:hypothetical protein
MSCVNLYTRKCYLLQQSERVYGVHKIQMFLPGRYVNVGTFVQNYGATEVAPTQKDEHLLSSTRRPDFHTHKRSWNENNLVMSPDGARKQERLCWRGPAAIYWIWTVPGIIILRTSCLYVYAQYIFVCGGGGDLYSSAGVLTSRR